MVLSCIERYTLCRTERSLLSCGFTVLDWLGSLEELTVGMIGWLVATIPK